jgi:tRNA threonylcarbamoyladenosine biosynthesis protein TsaB
MTQTDPSAQPLLLVVDTATARYAVALARGEQIIAEIGFESPGRTAHLIMSDIAALLERVGVAPRDLAAVGTLTGPGSFTGIRVGLATVKGLAHPLGLPIVTATTLEITAYGVKNPDRDTLLCVVNRAYRDQVHAQVFRPVENGGVSEFGEALSGAGPQIVGEILNSVESTRKPLIFTGDAFPELSEAIKSELVFRPVEWSVVASPPFLATVAMPVLLQRLREGKTTDARHLEAFYARPSEPERKFTPGS